MDKVKEINSERIKKATKFTEINTAVILASVITCSSFIVLIFTAVLSFCLYLVLDMRSEIQSLDEMRQVNEIRIRKLEDKTNERCQM